MDMRRVKIPSIDDVVELLEDGGRYGAAHVSPEDYVLLAVFLGRHLRYDDSIILNEKNAFFLLGRPIYIDPNADSQLTDRESEPATASAVPEEEPPPGGYGINESPDRGVDNTGEETP